MTYIDDVFYHIFPTQVPQEMCGLSQKESTGDSGMSPRPVDGSKLTCMMASSLEYEHDEGASYCVLKSLCNG